jgi:probable HAF family extracellular repeat protein
MRRFLCILLALGSVGAGQTKGDYIFTTLDGVVAHGINDLGDIVGAYQEQGYLYSAGSYTPINVPSSSRPSHTVAWAINNARQIVGSYSDADGLHGFLLSGGTYTRIDVPGAGQTFAFGINNAVQIVGSYQAGGDTGPELGFLLSNGSFSTIQRPGAPYTRVVAINDRGQLLGDNFVLTQGTLSGVHYPGSVDSYAFGLNNAGQIVGWYDDRSGQHGFLLTDGVYSSIDFPGTTGTAILGINDLDQLVGLYFDAAGNQHAFLATPVPEAPTLLAIIFGTGLVMSWTWRRNARPIPTADASPLHAILWP